MTEPDPKAMRDAQETSWRAAEGERLLVVGIGASAGGLEAFERFLRRAPHSIGLAFVFVQHLDPEHESILAEILGRETDIPVAFAKDGQEIEPDHVHVIPPDTTLLVERGRLRLVAAETRGTRQPINAFLTSLAEDQRENAVGIVLSGTGSDGALGIAAVKRHGGATFAQLPSDARYDSMPQAAIATGQVDQTLTVEEIPAALAELAARRRQHPGESARGESEGLRELFELLSRQTGHDFSRYKRSTILRRLHRRMTATSTATIRDYVAQLSRDEGESHQLTDDLMINVTAFFRDGEPFQALESVVIPDVLERHSSEGVRIWVPACASGEEAYTVAMLVRERLDRMKRPPKAQIFATDIDASALAEARRGRYGSVIEKQVSPERLARFFVKRGESYTVTKDIRDLCIFTAHDVARDPPFSRMDVVCCRNLLIYLEPALQRRVLETLHYALRPGGYLLLGKAEMMGTRELELFEVVEKADRLFRRRDGGRRPELPAIVEREASALLSGVAPLARRSGPDVRSAADRTRKIVLEEYAPASVVVDGRGEIRYLWGTDLGVYLPPQPGPPATNLMHLVRPELKVGLGASFHSAARQPSPVVHRDLTVLVDGVERRLNVVVRRVPATEQDPDELFLVVFQELRATAIARGEPLDAPTVERFRRLELELANSRERLQFTVDELENANEALRAANEQLQSTNEELHSSNEELQTSQEELQSVNEELNTVNAELSKKVDEMEVLLGDLQNLFQSTQIATVFLDRNLRISRFTPEAMAMFGFAEGDVGRALSDFAARFDAEGVPREVERVLQTLEPIDRTVRTAEGGRFFLMRINPYRTPSNVIAGVVMSFTDVTKLKEVESALREAMAERGRAEQALRDADRRKDEFLAVLSHELRNPLAPILNGVRILELTPPGGEEARRAQRIIARQAGHLSRLVDDLLDATRVSHGKLQLHREHLDLGDLVLRTAEDHREIFTARGLSLDVDAASATAWVDGDRTRLSQVIGNLLQNSAKFTPRGGSARLALEIAQGRAEVHLRDSGVGIERAMLPHLFEPFRQADATLDRSAGGLGLGLALVKGLVEAHGGDVEAKSFGRGTGTEFVVRLPLAAAPPDAREPEPGTPPRARRVLVIDDNDDGADTLRAVLELEGHTVEVAHDGPGGIERSREFRPDVVVCDVGLPGMSGYKVAQVLRSDPALRGTFLIALTGYALPDDQRRATDAGFDVHLAKPPTVEQLRSAIGRAP
ncbi:chemotaxis protein CheB [Anaeromyxobacter paludicola]|uniref:Protein-glutamate methylesterase n=1 Tax=Anaeromyxobacter paludicola TaxID=2918171 RepID=A0ABN6N5V1_9BACT|nr:chemotaxis protein CheB [Anaeromyxobacter paludicola]BDG08569.1 protein-glutamate methylesterase [Anaeromyxobacter paludicola]